MRDVTSRKFPIFNVGMDVKCNLQMETSSIVKGKVFCFPNEGDFLKLCHYYYD